MVIISKSTKIEEKGKINENNPVIGGLFQSKPTQDIKREIVVELLNSESRLDEKTELGNPVRWACLYSMKEYILNLGLKYTAEIIEKFIKKTHKFLISKDRKGRKEYIEALNAIALMEKNTVKEPSKVEQMLS